MALFGGQKLHENMCVLWPKKCCQRWQAGIYSVPSLAPLTIKVSQVEMEAGDCEGRSASAFLPEVRDPRSEVGSQKSEVTSKVSRMPLR